MVIAVKYKIVCIKIPFVELVNTYPTLISDIYQEQNNMYKTKQIELMFSKMISEKEKLLHNIQERENYSYYHGVHQLKNPITHEKIFISMNEYDLDVEEEGNHHYIFDMISTFSKNFYMILK